MLSSHSDQASGAAPQQPARSPDSIAFEDIWTAAKGGDPVPSRNAVDLRRFAKFAANMAIIEPDPSALSLPFRLCGSWFFDLFGFDLTGMDYLEFVDPAIKQNAHAYVMACLEQPCGLWQRTPAQVDNGELAQFEYTILPIAKNGGAADHILIFVTRIRLASGEMPTVKRIEHSTVWQWLDIGFGMPALQNTDRPF